MPSEPAFPHIRCCLSAIPSGLMRSTAVWKLVFNESTVLFQRKSTSTNSRFCIYICFWCLYPHIAVIFYHKLYFTIFFISYPLIIYILYIDIAFTYLSFFFHMSIWIFWHTYILWKFFSKFCLPDVISVVSVLFTMISLVVSICVILGDDDEANEVEFVLIYICDKQSETLHWYYIT